MTATPTTPLPALRRQRRKGEITAERILDAAEALFAERGFAGTTLRDVAAEVGLRNPSLYNHFQSKESLYAAVLERGISPVMRVLSAFVDSRRERNSAQVVESVMELLARRPNLPRLILQETLSGGQRLTPMLRDQIAPVFAKAHEITEATPAAEIWGRDRIPLVVLAMYHIVVGYFTIAPLYQELIGEDLLTREAQERQTRFLVDIVETLIEGREPRSHADPKSTQEKSE